jgi:hypothetical protein
MGCASSRQVKNRHVVHWVQAAEEGIASEVPDTQRMATPVCIAPLAKYSYIGRSPIVEEPSPSIPSPTADIPNKHSLVREARPKLHS